MTVEFAGFVYRLGMFAGAVLAYASILVLMGVMSIIDWVKQPKGEGV